MENAYVARLLDEIGLLSELLGRPSAVARGYRSVAESIRALECPLRDVWGRGALLSFLGRCASLAPEIEEILSSGTCESLAELRAQVPPALLDLAFASELDGKTIRKLWKTGGVESTDAFSRISDEALARLGRDTQSKVRAARSVLEGPNAWTLSRALTIADEIIRLLAKRGAKHATLVGDARRGHEVAAVVEIAVRSMSPLAIAGACREAARDLGIERVVESGDLVTLDFEWGSVAKIFAVDAADYLFTVIERTGSHAHVAELEKLAAPRGGLFALARRCRSETDLYAELDLPFVPPELRDGLSQAPRGELVDGVYGCFHVHTTWSDGSASVLEMATRARLEGLRYLGISDHSQAASYANGLSAERLEKQRSDVHAASRALGGISILHGVEVDILADGTLDLDDRTLSQLDFVVASVHSHLTMTPREMTARLIRAVSHPLVTILGHPTGRLLLARPGYDYDLTAVARAASANDTYLEVNANAQRLDLSSADAMRAHAVGAKFAINPDAHTPDGLVDTRLGVIVARRARLAKTDVLNALDEPALRASLHDRKAKAIVRLGKLAPSVRR